MRMEKWAKSAVVVVMGLVLTFSSACTIFGEDYSSSSVSFEDSFVDNPSCSVSNVESFAPSSEAGKSESSCEDSSTPSSEADSLTSSSVDSALQSSIENSTDGSVDEYLGEETEKYTYNIIDVTAHYAYSTNKAITLMFWNHSIDENTVDFGYCIGTPGASGWRSPDADTMAFLQYIKINGQSVLSVYPSCQLQGGDQYNGLRLSGVYVRVNDVITIDKGAVFRHNGKTAYMEFTFVLQWNGSSYIPSKS